MYESFTLYTAAMDRTHTVFAVLLNLFSVQLTFCGSADPMLFLQSPPTTLSRSAHPFIQAQFHPASGTIQQGIMLPREHIMPLERIPEELYYQGRMMPEDSMFHERRIVPQQHFLPHESTESQDYMTPQETTISEQRILPPEPMKQDRTQTTMDHMPSLETAPSHQKIIPSQQELQVLRIRERFNQENGNSQQRMVAQENIQKLIHTSAPHPHLPKQDEQMTNDVTETQSDKRLEEDLRAVKSGYEYPHAPYPQSPYGYTAPASSAPYSPPTSTYTPPAEHPESPTKDLLKPDLSELIKPVTGKIAGKLNGLVGLLSLFGSGKGLELGGIKDLLFEGILKPLLVAKGGLKALISKLAIPVVALILINVEVLITVWWLWEDCPEAKPVEYSKPSYPAPSYNYR